MSRRMHISKEAARNLDGYKPALEDTLVPPPRRVQPQENAPQARPAACGVDAAWRTDKGKIRASNQDAVIFCGSLMGVADGMGGHQGGEVASGQLRDLLIAQLKDKEWKPAVLASAVRLANRRLFIMSQQNEHLRGMGTTLDLLWFGPDKVACAHVGDSRVYLLRDGVLRQVTDDHSMVMEMVRAGLIDKEQAARHPMRNVITRAVGTENSVDVDLMTIDRQKEDMWLVCSDGLHGMVRDEDIQDVLTRYAPSEAAGELMMRALAAGGTDNVTLVVVRDREGSHE